MKNLLITLAIAISFLTLMACGGDECYECTNTGVPTVEICEDSPGLGDSITLENYISTWEALGGTCTKK